MVIIKSIYLCGICGEEYSTLEKAEACERILTPCPCFEVGDSVRVTTGEGKGEIVKIVDYSHVKTNSAPRQFAHMVQYCVKFDNGDSRTLIEGIDCEGV